mmetsp:Transcript_673/g.1435  ORF Transcript_673/g.1435 Transcript_673/m.1435 type:complete len:262 (+) Transcript_673:616-1401(+)
MEARSLLWPVTPRFSAGLIRFSSFFDRLSFFSLVSTDFVCIPIFFVSSYLLDFSPTDSSSTLFLISLNLLPSSAIASALRCLFSSWIFFVLISRCLFSSCIFSAYNASRASRASFVSASMRFLSSSNSFAFRASSPTIFSASRCFCSTSNFVASKASCATLASASIRFRFSFISFAFLASSNAFASASRCSFSFSNLFASMVSSTAFASASSRFRCSSALCILMASRAALISASTCSSNRLASKAFSAALASAALASASCR